MSFVAVAGCYGDFGSAVEGSAVHGECASCFEISVPEREVGFQLPAG